MKLLKRILLSAALVYLGFGFYLYLVQRSFIYFPVAPAQTPHDERIFTHAGHKVKATVLNGEQRDALLYFGGNAEQVDFNATDFLRQFPDFAVYLVKYRGYGGSSGEPTEQALYEDALHIFDQINPDHASVSIMGRSLGSAVATHVAAHRQVHKLVLVTPFDSIQNVAQAQFPIYPMALLLKDKHDSLSRVADIQTDTLVIAAENDRIIGLRHTQQLVAGFSRKVKFHIVENTGHNNISRHPRYFGILRLFLQDPPSLGTAYGTQ